MYLALTHKDLWVEGAEGKGFNGLREGDSTDLVAG